MKALLPVLLLALVSCTAGNGEEETALSHLNGPGDRSEIKEDVSYSFKGQYDSFSTKIGIYPTIEESAVLGLVHAFKSWGIPFQVFTDLQEALGSDIVFVYPYISGKVLSSTQLSMLKNYVEEGGTLVASHILGGGLQRLGGFSALEEGKSHYSLIFNRGEYFDLYNEKGFRTLRFGDEEITNSSIGSHSFVITSAEILAVYGDGRGAIIHNKYGAGHCFVLGFDPGFLLLRAYNHRTDGWYSDYVNSFSPGVDLLLHFFERIYRKHALFPVLLGRTPRDFPLVVVISHDVDYSKSYENSILYAELEAQFGIKATYFIQTKYVADYQDAALLDGKTIEALLKIQEMGMEIASHSVSHSYAFADFPLGSGKEAYPGYKPVIVDEKLTRGGTVFGELRVSKFILEALIDGVEIRSFRPGFLGYPFVLPQALEAVGYKYSSSVTANSTLTNLPFRLTFDRAYGKPTSIFEFPITIEDEKLPPMDRRVEESLEIAEKISAYNGIFVVLIHPNETEHKYGYLKKFLEATSSLYWFGTLGELGDWWSIRDGLELSVENDGDRRVLKFISGGDFISGLRLHIAAGWDLVSEAPGAVQVGKSIYLDGPRESFMLVFRKAQI